MKNDYPITVRYATSRLEREVDKDNKGCGCMGCGCLAGSVFLVGIVIGSIYGIYTFFY